MLFAFANLVVPACAADKPAAPQRAAAVSGNEQRARSAIRVIGGGWGDARNEDIETVLNSVASVLLDNFPGWRLDPIVVTHTDRPPVTLFKRGANNEYRVRLSVKDRYWARYAYEFAHELSHILTHYEHHAYPVGTTYNQWFEESLCEVASLFALRQLSAVWESSPPYRHWVAYAPNFERYAQHLLSERHRRLPPEVSLAAWFERNAADLTQTPYLRSHNEIVANVLLPLFEENPQIWEAIGYLNLEADSGNFRDYLRAWHANAPDDYKDIIEYITTLFGLAGKNQASRAGASMPAAAAAIRTPSPAASPGPTGPVARGAR